MDTPQAIARAYIAEETVDNIVETLPTKLDAMGVGISIGLSVAAVVLKHYPQLESDLISTEEMSKPAIDELLHLAGKRLSPTWENRN